MNFKNATKQQLLQIATDEDCDINLKYRSCEQLQVKFKIDVYRKGNTDNNFNPKLSNYWQQQYYDYFGRWY